MQPLDFAINFIIIIIKGRRTATIDGWRWTGRHWRQRRLWLKSAYQVAVLAAYLPSRELLLLLLLWTIAMREGSGEEEEEEV